MNKDKRKKQLKIYFRRTKKVLKRRNKKNYCNRLKNNSVLSSSVELTFLKHRKFISRGHYYSNKAILTIPSRFTLTSNPNETLKVLKQLVHICTNTNIKEVVIDHSKCEEVGIAASTIMDSIIIQMEHIRNKSRNKINFSGRIPYNNPKVKALLVASGILKHLGFEEEENLEENVITLELQRGSQHSSGTVSTKITDYFIECLEANNLTLEDEGRNILSGFIGEVIDNCTTHAGYYLDENTANFLKWYALGHYHHYSEGHGEFHLVLFNYGKTIYEGLKETEDTYIRSILEALTNKRVKDIKSGKTTEETLWTLYSLQEGISRLKHTDQTRGTGTVHLIEAFRDISGNRNGEAPTMSITSGAAHIIFDKGYSMGSDEYNVLKESAANKSQVIAFNQENNLNLSPNYKYVKTLKHKFPGTVISMKFPLDRKYIDNIRRDKDGE